MGRQVSVRAIRKEEPDIHLYVLALIALARQLQEEEKQQAVESEASVTQAEEEAADGRS